jgi:molybdenum cofactor guanylyltransferase
MTSAAILAGGRARRLDGRDKSQLRIGGRTILDAQIAALGARVTRVFVVGAGGRAGHVPPLIQVADRAADCGPLGGLDAALAAAGDESVLLLACDMPNVTAPLLAYLIDSLDDADAVVPRTERGYHPLCAVYAQSCRVPVQRRLERGQLRMRDLLGDLRVRSVDVAEVARFGDANYLLANVNTQTDLDALESLQNH